MRLNQSLFQKQTQNLMLKPKMLQSLEMLTMPMLELEIFLKHELETNPMMELQDQRDEEEEKDKDFDKKNKEEIDKTEIKLDDEPELSRTLDDTKELSEILDTWNDQFEEYSYKSSSPEKANFDQFIKPNEDKISEFFDQLDEINLIDNEYDFCYDLIDSANAHGFLPVGFDIYSFAEEYEISEERSDELHKFILHFDPQGITSRNIEECLIVQLDDDKKNNLLINLIKQDFDNLIHKRYKKIAANYNVTFNTIIAWKEQISQLDPKPGLRLLQNQQDYIMPDVIIKKIGEDYEIIINDYYFPKIQMSRRYKSILKDVRSDKKAVDYVRGKINSAKFLIKSIYLRNKTLKRVVKAIIKYQHDFFYEEGGALKPLTYSVIAGELQVNESTISRVVRTKYADTPFGIMCLKDFFTSKAGKDLNYDAVSRQSVEVKVKKYIEAEDILNPLSDQEIADMLQEEGIKVSRRVVAKYRKSLGILNSHLRRKD